jgi:hypothetical protein
MLAILLSFPWPTDAKTSPAARGRRGAAVLPLNFRLA